MRALVTGATGFVGSHLTEALVKRGHATAVLLRGQSDPWRLREVLPQLCRIPGDLNDLVAARKAIEEFGPDTVFHLGWHGVAGGNRNDDEQVDMNLGASVALARLARELDCKCMVGLGSQAEYGPWLEPISESTPTNPTTLYGAAKLSVFHVVRTMLAHTAVRFAWLRLFSSYGPKDNPHWLIPYIIRTLLEGKRPSLTLGEQRWDYVYVEDAAQAIYKVASCPEASGTFNVGSGVSIPLRTIVESIRDQIDPTLPLGFGEIPYRRDQVMFLQADIGRIRSVTGWTPSTPLQIGLRRTLTSTAAGEASHRAQRCSS